MPAWFLTVLMILGPLVAIGVGGTLLMRFLRSIYESGKNDGREEVLREITTARVLKKETGAQPPK